MRFADCFQGGQLTRSFRLHIMWRVVKAELQWRLIRFGLWWHETMPVWLMGRDKKAWGGLAENVLEMEISPDDDDGIDDPPGYLSHAEIERFERQEPQ